MPSPLNSFVGQRLTWLPTATLKNRYDLIAPDTSSLAGLDMSSWTSRASAYIPEGTLFLRKKSWTGLKVVLSLSENGPELATYQSNWAGSSGEVFFSNGRAFKWNKANFWGTRKVWTDLSGSMTYLQFSTDGFSRKVAVDLLPPAAEIPELSFLLVLGLYNILVERQSAAVAGATASFVVAS